MNFLTCTFCVLYEINNYLFKCDNLFSYSTNSKNYFALRMSIANLIKILSISRKMEGKMRNDLFIFFVDEMNNRMQSDFWWNYPLNKEKLYFILLNKYITTAHPQCSGRSISINACEV